MILRPSIILGRIGIDRTLFVLQIANEVHPWWMIKGWCHRLELRKSKMWGKKGLEGLEVKRRERGYAEGEKG